MSCAYIGYAKRHGLGRWEVKEDGWSDADIEGWRDVEAALKAKVGTTQAPKEWKRMKRGA